MPSDAKASLLATGCFVLCLLLSFFFRLRYDVVVRGSRDSRFVGSLMRLDGAWYRVVAARRHVEFPERPARDPHWDLFLRRLRGGEAAVHEVMGE